MEASDIEHITRNVKAKVWGTPGVISIDLQKIINNEENINLSYPEAWEKVKAILSFPKDRLIKAIMVFERWAKNPAQKNLQYMGMACLSTLAEIMKIEKEIKPKLLKQEVGSNNK